MPETLLEQQKHNLSWQCLSNNEVWVAHDFLTRNEAEDAAKQLLTSELKNLDGGRSPHFVSGTPYNYNIHLSDLFFEKYGEKIWNRLGSFFSFMNLQIPALDQANLMQFFPKSFSQDSWYEVHSEPPNLFGDFAYVIYLSTESTGAIRFFSPDELSRYLREDQTRFENWKASAEFFRNNDLVIRDVEPLRFLPKAGSCLVFRTGTPHMVEKCISSALCRPSFAGWPGASNLRTLWAKKNAQK